MHKVFEPLFRPLIVEKGMLTPEDKIAANFSEVKQLAQEIAPDLKVVYGAEIYFSSDVLENLNKYHSKTQWHSLCFD